MNLQIIIYNYKVGIRGTDEKLGVRRKSKNCKIAISRRTKFEGKSSQKIVERKRVFQNKDLEKFKNSVESGINKEKTTVSHKQ